MGWTWCWTGGLKASHEKTEGESEWKLLTMAVMILLTKYFLSFDMADIVVRDVCRTT